MEENEQHPLPQPVYFLLSAAMYVISDGRACCAFYAQQQMPVAVPYALILELLLI